jgi:hypothetical protein
MEPIFKQEHQTLGIDNLEIFEAVIDGDSSYYPVRVNEKMYHIRINEEACWRVEGLPEEVCTYIGHLIEHHKL